jgi:hypothetical protein
MADSNPRVEFPSSEWIEELHVTGLLMKAEEKRRW